MYLEEVLGVQIGPKRQLAVSFEMCACPTDLHLIFLEMADDPKKLWRRVSSVPPVPPGLRITIVPKCNSYPLLKT